MRKGVVTGFLKHDTTSRGPRSTIEATGEMTMIRTADAVKNGDVAEEENLPRDWYPFDPYALPRSKGFVADCFLEYTPSDPEDDEDMVTEGDDTDGSEEDMEDDM